MTEPNGEKFLIAQSGAIIRFAASRVGLAGRNDIETAKCDMLQEQIKDTFEYLLPYYKMKDSEEKRALLDKALTEWVPAEYKLIQNVLEANKNGNGFLVGDQLTYVDLDLMNRYNMIN